MKVLEQIEQVLNLRVRPELSGHSGSIESVSYEDGVYRYRLVGQCCNCPSASLHMEALLKRELSTVLPDLKEVALQAVNQETIEQAMEILRRSKLKYEERVPG